MVSYDKYLELKNQGLTRAEIAAVFEIPDWKLKKLIAANGWGKKLPTIEFENAFKEQDEYACYWAGFIAADGNVDSKNRLRVMLNYDDTAHLEKLRDFLGSTHTISSNTTAYYRSSLELTSKELVQDLQTLFLINPNKTDCLKFPAHLTDQQLSWYMRGYFDGDGCICESFSNKNSITSTLYTTIASGSVDFIYPAFSKLQLLLNLGGSLQDFKDKNSMQIKFNTNDSITLLTWMYKDAEVYLDRKYALYVKTVINNNRTIR